MLAGGVQTGDGEVTITFEAAAAVPEPASFALLGLALLMLGVAVNRGQRRYR